MTRSDISKKTHFYVKSDGKSKKCVLEVPIEDGYQCGKMGKLGKI